MRFATKFPLGRIVATPGAIAALQEAHEHPLTLIKRHAFGDWGDLHPDDQLANEKALRTGMRLLSSYTLSTGERVWLITEASPRMLLPDEH